MKKFSTSFAKKFVPGRFLKESPALSPPANVAVFVTAFA
jgi:hypothetical protein